MWGFLVAAAVAEDGVLVVTVDPTAHRCDDGSPTLVAVDGENLGALEGRPEVALDPGLHVLRVEQHGFRPYEATVYVPAGEPVWHEVPSLERRGLHPGWLVVPAAALIAAAVPAALGARAAGIGGIGF